MKTCFMKLYFLILKVVVPLLFLPGGLPLVGFSHVPEPVFSLHYTVDRMTHEKILSGPVPEEYIEPLPKSVRYSMTYQAKTDGSFFCSTLHGRQSFLTRSISLKWRKFPGY